MAERRKKHGRACGGAGRLGPFAGAGRLLRYLDGGFPQPALGGFC
jgi:hypothetical protein